MHRAYLTAYAHWDGKQLDRERETLLGRLHTREDLLPDTDAVIAAAHAYIDGAPRPAAPE